jgi:hypothetical protein
MKNFFRTIKAIAILVLFSFVSSGIVAQTYQNNFEQKNTAGLWSDTHPIFDSTAFEGDFIGRIKPSHLYSQVLETEIVDSLWNQNLRISFDGRFRVLSPTTKAVYVISIMRGDSLLFWYGFKIDEQINEVDEWNKVAASFLIPASHTQNSRIKAYLWNQGSAEIDVDNISIKAEIEAMASFMPTLTHTEPEGHFEVLLKSDFFEVIQYPHSGELFISDSVGQKILGPIVLFSETDKTKTTSSKWKLQKTEIKDSYQILHFNNRIEGQKNKLILTANKLNGELSISLESSFLRKTKLFRQSILAFYEDEPMEIYRSNSLLDTDTFQEEYYLGMGGASIGKGFRNLLFYHNPELTSIQINTKQRLLAFNADFAADHPMIHYPLLEDSADYFEDISYSFWKRKSQLKTDFTLFFGRNIEALPRLMPVPGGFEAAVIWTEHADWADISTHRAVNFGHEDIRFAADATGGFVKYGIPVTKSVFYNNPDSINNSEISGGIFTDLHSTIQTDSTFFEMLGQLHELGHEICLHTPEQFTSDRTNLKESMAFMQKHFGSSSWIDHGYNNKAENNRENLVCDGLLKKSPLFSADLWKEHGLKYFWNPYFEEVSPYNAYGFDAQLMIPFPGFGDGFPQKILSRHPTRFDGWLWNTTGTLEVPEERLWDYFFHPVRLGELIRYRSIWINHVYPAWANEIKGFWTYDEAGKIVAMPGFNNALSRLATLREARLILPTTIKEMMHYQESLLQIEFVYTSENEIIIINHNPHIINDLSLTIKASQVEVEGKKTTSKRSGDDLIFWFDISAGESLTLRIYH